MSELLPLSDSVIDELTNQVLLTVRGQSKRVYEHTYGQWVDWCHGHSVSPLTFINIPAFLESQTVTRATRRRQLSAMRTLVEVAAIINAAQFEAMYRLIKKYKISDDNLSDTERDLNALTPSQVHKILSVWNENKNAELRNRALMGVLFLTAVRRAEAAALEWRDVNLETYIIKIRHGKGDKERDVAIAGEFAVEALQNWRKRCPDRRYVFCSINKGDKLGEDKPMTPDAVYKIVQLTEKYSGVEFTPHTARRTFITEALTTNAMLSDVQQQAGHASEATTLRYARPVSAQERRGRLRLRYGD